MMLIENLYSANFSFAFCRWSAHHARFPMLLLLTFLMHFARDVFSQGGNTDSSGAESHRRDVITRFFERQASVRYIYQVMISPDAGAVVWSADAPQGSQAIYLAPVAKRDSAVRITAVTTAGAWCNETEPQWSPDGREIAFLSDARSEGQLQVFIAGAASGKLVRAEPLTTLDGYISHLRWSPDGKYLSVLYVEKASREPSPMAAANKAVGLIDSTLNRDVQRIAVIDRLTGRTDEITPRNLYVFEYDWSPDSRNFVYTAAPPPGDNNWYIARLYRQGMASEDTVLLYKPTFQIALPRWSMDGYRIAFIEGLMSDQGGTGGEICTIPASGGSKPNNLTPGRRSTPSWFTWRPDGNILFTEFVGGSVAISTLDAASGRTKQLWKADESIRAGLEETSLSVAGNKALTVAVIRSSWDKLPEIYYGAPARLTQFTHLNIALQNQDIRSENMVWDNEGQRVQGWLLYPADYVPSKMYPMVVCVHGGPAWITTPTWSAPDFNTTVYTKLGYFLFFPNPRGSLGQGEAFTKANRRDWGFGDLRDVSSGVDAVIKKFPVDSTRVGILGWSYGGSMAMFAITQSNKFRAAVAGAAAADWESYYGQNRIDKWMWSYFGASPYDDPAAYVKSSAMTYIKRAKTPTLVLVGERDGEAPAMQSFQFWHALRELQVPTQLMVYAEEGHSFSRFENMIDVSVRTIEWFNTHMKP